MSRTNLSRRRIGPSAPAPAEPVATQPPPTPPLPPTPPAPPSPSPTPPLSQRQLWLAAVKPPMYTVAVTPILVGSAAAYADTTSFSLPTLLAFLSAAVAIIAWLNLTNDVFDFDTGIDVNKRESVVNLCGATRDARNAVLGVACAFLAAAFAALGALSRAHGAFDATVLVVVGMAVAGGYMYQGPPFRLGYYGLGEPICFVTWAISVAAAYYSQLLADDTMRDAIHHDFPTTAARVLYLLGDMLWSHDRRLFASALLVAAPTAIILFCSHFHQAEDDRRAGKASPIVRLGTARALMVLEFALVCMLFVEVVLHGVGMLPAKPFYLSFLAIPSALQLANFVRQNHEVPEAVRAAKYYAVKFHFLHGVLLALGLALSVGEGSASW